GAGVGVAGTGVGGVGVGVAPPPPPPLWLPLFPSPWLPLSPLLPLLPLLPSPVAGLVLTTVLAVSRAAEDDAYARAGSVRNGAAIMKTAAIASTRGMCLGTTPRFGRPATSPPWRCKVRAFASPPYDGFAVSSDPCGPRASRTDPTSIPSAG